MDSFTRDVYVGFEKEEKSIRGISKQDYHGIRTMTSDLHDKDNCD